jgi:hypothetical protein
MRRSPFILSVAVMLGVVVSSPTAFARSDIKARGANSRFLHHYAWFAPQWCGDRSRARHASFCRRPYTWADIQGIRRLERMP